VAALATFQFEFCGYVTTMPLTFLTLGSSSVIAGLHYIRKMSHVDEEQENTCSQDQFCSGFWQKQNLLWRRRAVCQAYEDGGYVKDIRLHSACKSATQNLDFEADDETDAYVEDSFHFKQMVGRVDGLLLFKPDFDEPTEIINAYLDVLEEVIQELSHGDNQKCRCADIILKTQHSWIVLDETKYWDAARTALPISYNWTGKREPCWLQHKYLEHSTQGHIYDPFDMEIFYDEIVDQMN